MTKAHEIDAVADALTRARFPVVAAGSGVMRTRAMEALSQLSMKLQAPVVFAQDAIGVISEKHPFFAGHFAHDGLHPMCRDALQRADVVLALGLPAAAAEALRGRVKKRLIVVASDHEQNDRRCGHERPVDPKSFLDALLGRLADYQRTWDEPLVRHMAETKAGLVGVPPATKL